MEITKNAKSFQFDIRTFTSISGEAFTLDDSFIQKRVQDFITKLESDEEENCKKSDIVFEFDSTEDKLSTQIASNTFFKNFYISYYGNPSQNGGNFNFKAYDVTKDTNHLYHDSGKKKGNGYQYYIAKGLACNLPYRSWGYGVNQIGTKFIYEEKEAAKDFAEFMIDKSCMDLNGNNPHVESKFKKNIGEGLFWYCVRSLYFDRLGELVGYITNLEHMPLMVESMYADLTKELTEDGIKRKGYKTWLKNQLDKIAGVESVLDLNESNLYEDAAYAFEAIYDSPGNKLFKFLVKNEDNTYSLDLDAINNLEEVEVPQ